MSQPSLETLIREVAGPDATSAEHDHITDTVLAKILAEPEPELYLRPLVHSAVTATITQRPTSQAEHEHAVESGYPGFPAYDEPSSEPARGSRRGQRPEGMSNGTRPRGGVNTQTGLPGFLYKEVWVPVLNAYKAWGELNLDEVRNVAEWRNSRAQAFLKGYRFAHEQLTLFLTVPDATNLLEVYKASGTADPGTDPLN
jgi:hypothetical protein